MHGKDVAYARRLLIDNVFKTSFHPGEKGQGYNEDVAAATRRAKLALGYPKAGVNQTFGDKLERYLLGRDKLPFLYKRRRAARAVKPDMGTLALREAERWIGTKEQPAGSNRCEPFTGWYGMIGPWCAVFTSWCMDKAGFKYISPASANWAYVPYIVADARAGRDGLRLVSYADVEPGDLVCYDWDNDGVADHVGFFQRKSNQSSFTAVEGNTAVGNDSNGGQVMVRTRFTSDVIAFVAYR